MDTLPTVQVLVATILLIILPLLFILSSSRAKAATQKSRLDQIRSIYNLDIKEEDEKPLKITQLFMYPCRGVTGIEVD